ncbi:MAG: DUF2339 domain-containing protein, partial [Leptospiraceae bacterium]|nr:DUF2339 domain-containing protein [Leptospiraceae bacterium]
MDEQRLNQFGQRLQRLETELRELRTAFASLQSESTTPAESAPSGVSTGPAPTAPGAAASAPPKAKQRKSISAASVESFLGGNLLGKLGLLALVLATAWFIKLAFDNHWINASGRIYTGLVLSFVTCAGSFYLAKRNYRIIAPAITGAALAMMYISIFGAYYFYDLLGRTETFLFLVLITVWGSFLAVRAGSQILYLFSTGGALLAPLILSTGENSYRFLFFYLLLIWVGYLVVSYYRFWRVAAYVLLAAVHLIYAVWAAEKLS